MIALKRLTTVLATALAGLGLFTGSASAFNAILPVSSSLTSVPASVSFPSSPDFQYRIDLTAGPDGAHFIFTAPQPHWGFRGMAGSPFSIKPPTLDGPGSLAPSLAIAADPPAWACSRGAYAGSQNWYELRLDPGLSTTIVFDALTEAAPLAGMNTDIGMRLENQDYPILLHTQTAVGGKPGIRIVSQIAGTQPNLLARRGINGRFRLKGYTDPPLANRAIEFTATSVSGHFKSGKLPEAQRFLVLKTNSEGRFRSKPFQMQNEPYQTMAITSRLTSPGKFARESSCGPALRIVKSRRAVRPR